MIEVRQISTKSNDFKNIKRVYNTVFRKQSITVRIEKIGIMSYRKW